MARGTVVIRCLSEKKGKKKIKSLKTLCPRQLKIGKSCTLNPNLGEPDNAPMRTDSNPAVGARRLIQAWHSFKVDLEFELRAW